MLLKALLSTLVFIGSLTLTTAPIQAATFTDTDSFSAEITELTDQPLRVDPFDASLGTLTKVTVTLSGSLSSVGTVTNTAAQAQSFTVSTRAQQYDGTKSGGSPAVLPSTFQVFTPFDLIGSQAYTALAPNTPAAFGPYSADRGPLIVFTSTSLADLAQFVGGGAFGYNFNTLILTAVQGGGGNVTTAINTNASASLSVTYEFEGDVAVIPEPTTVSLVGLGLLGLAYARRRQSQKV